VSVAEHAVNLSDADIWLRLAVALGVGFLIGLERGFATRQLAEGARVAGLRTHALLSVLGALIVLLVGEPGGLPWAFAFLAVAGVILGAHYLHVQRDRDVGATSVVALLLTFVLGGVAMQGHLAAAAGAAVIAAVLLSAKQPLHQWIERLERRELIAALQFLLISVVVLPVLPDRGYGPWQALNPYEIWWLVVLVAGISFTGYVAIRRFGEQRGLLLTALLGGLVSSTAVTVDYAKLAQQRHGQSNLLAAGVLLAGGVMFARSLALASLLAPPLAPRLALPLLLMAAACHLGAWRLSRDGSEAAAGTLALRNPFEWRMALQFGALLALIMLLSRAAYAGFGNQGIYALALFSGLADVDAVTITVARMTELPLAVAVVAVLLATTANTVVKGALVATIAGRPMARLVVPVFAIALVLGPGAAWLMAR
jgi:uncharacterized membrane protein (DUF4010 family)